MTQEALNLALEALKDGDWYINQLEMIVYCVDNDEIHFNRAKVQTAITAIKEALTQTEHNFCPRCGKRTKDIHTCTPPQRTWVGLTDEEIQTIVNKVASEYQTSDTFARAIEAKLKEKTHDTSTKSI